MKSTTVQIGTIILCLCITSNECIFTKLAKKIKSFFKQTSPSVSEFPMGNVLEYPGHDEQLRIAVSEEWKAYYDCLNKNFKSLGPQKAVTPEAIMKLEGSSIRLDCKMCVSPEEMENEDSAQWYYTEIPPKALTQIEYGANIFLSPMDKVLHIHNLAQSNTGQYQCKFGLTVTAPYILEVINYSEPFLKVKPNSAPTAMHSIPAVNIPGEPYLVFTSWQPWSPCNMCGKAGKKTRFGICTVKLLLEYNSSTIETRSNETSIGDDKSKQKSNLPEDATDLLVLFKTGIPCRSLLLPTSFKDLPEIKNRKSEIMTAFCKVPCESPKVFALLDDKGEVIEAANNSEGVYSALQDLPPAPPEVIRENMHEETSVYKIIIGCPGNINPDKPVQWQVQNKLLQPQLIEHQSKGRIYIDETNRINLKKPHVTDSNAYSCWQGEDLIGVVTLTVVPSTKLSFNHYIMLFSLVIICAAILLVFFRAFKGRKAAAAAVSF